MGYGKICLYVCVYFFKMGKIISCLNALIIFCIYCNNLLEPEWPKTIEIYSLIVLETKSLKSKCQHNCTASGGSGKNPSLPLPSSGGSRQSLASLAVSLQFLSPCLHCFFLFPCLHLLFHLF